MAHKITAAELQARWQQYCKQCDEHVETVKYRGELMQVPKRIIYTLGSFCCFAGIEEEKLDKLGRHKSFTTLVKAIKYAILSRMVEALVNGEGSTSGLIFDLKADYGLHLKAGTKNEDWHITMHLGDDEFGNPVIEEYGTAKKSSRKKKKQRATGDDVTAEKRPDDDGSQPQQPLPVTPAPLPPAQTTGKYYIY